MQTKLELLRLHDEGSHPLSKYEENHIKKRINKIKDLLAKMKQVSFVVGLLTANCFIKDLSQNCTTKFRKNLGEIEETSCSVTVQSCSLLGTLIQSIIGISLYC